MTGCQCASITDDDGKRLTQDDRYAALWWATTTAVAAFVDYRPPQEDN